MGVGVWYAPVSRAPICVARVMWWVSQKVRVAGGRFHAVLHVVVESHDGVFLLSGCGVSGVFSGFFVLCFLDWCVRVDDKVYG